MMGGRYSIIAKYKTSPYWDYSDYYVPNRISLLFKAIECFAKYDVVEITKHY